MEIIYLLEFGTRSLETYLFSNAIFTMADPESVQKFDAAVKVIRSLPKSGSFKPTHEMMLNFYGNYKQAMEGPCKGAKPAFWDVVNKAKWEAWSKLGNISKKDAMENYVNALKKIIEEMPETEQASQFVTSLEPFYKAVYCNEKDPPPILKMFRSNQSNGHTPRMNGHIKEMNGNGESEHHSPSNGVILNTSDASFVHNIESVDYPERNNIDNQLEVMDNEMTCDINRDDLDSGTTVGVIASGYIELNGGTQQNGDKSSNEYGDNDGKQEGDDDEDDDDEDGDDDDDDDLFCDSLGPEFLEQQADVSHTSEAHFIRSDEYAKSHSSLSDVEVIEQFGSRKEDVSLQAVNQIPHVHFDDLESSSSGERNTLKKHGHVSRTIQCKSDMVQPNQLGVGGGGGDDTELLRGTSERKHVQRNVKQQSDKHSRYGHHYRRRSQESDSDDSPHRSDPNSSSEREDIVIDRIADLLIEIQDSMKKILERLKRVEDSLQRSQNSWYEKYIPSKTVVFLILWPFVVNIIVRYLRRRNANPPNR